MQRFHQNGALMPAKALSINNLNRRVQTSEEARAPSYRLSHTGVRSTNCLGIFGESRYPIGLTGDKIVSPIAPAVLRNRKSRLFISSSSSLCACFTSVSDCNGCFCCPNTLRMQNAMLFDVG